MAKTIRTATKRATVRKKTPTKKIPSRQKGLAHHRHTGKMLPRQHTSYPGITFLLLLMGIVLLMISFSVKAAEVSVTATAYGPLPPDPAVITSPTEGKQFSAIPIDVEGTCPEGLFYVKLYRNNLFTGSAVCSGTGTFKITTDLFEGANELRAQSVNGADQLGPTSDPVNVMYAPPVPPAPSANPAAPPAVAVSQLAVVSKHTYQSGRPGETIEWEFEISGGQAPYAVSIDWGDGETAVISRNENGSFKATHMYRESGHFLGTYPVIIKVSDVGSRAAYLQVFTIINAPLSAVGPTQFGPPDASPTTRELRNALLISWPLYVLAIMMTVSFWLGERREFEILRHAGRLRR